MFSQNCCYDRYPLTELEILALDCQTTGATPLKGQLLEIGWLSSRAGSPEAALSAAIRSFVVAGSRQVPIPKAVQKITGITADDLKEAIAEAAVWHQLTQTAAVIAAHNRSGLCPTVIHYARFEKPFLQALHQTHSPQLPFPFEIICTHAIATRLLPTLPRRGLRALAGFLGHSLPEQRRSGSHVLATVHIWRQLVLLLSSQFGIENLSQLQIWLSQAAPPATPGRAYPMSPRLRLNLPDSPGVYRMRRSNGDLLYVGKAKSLRQRVSSYFRPKAAHAEHILEMLTQARDVEVTPTASALEAALLEVEQIKRWAPPYNQALRNHHRPIFFCRDLTDFSTLADECFCLGPLPENQTGNAMAAFGTWIADGMPLDESMPTTVTTMANLTPEYAPAPICLMAGLNLFRGQHGGVLANRPAWRALIALGAELWKDQPPEDEPGDKADQQADHFAIEDELAAAPGEHPSLKNSWTPEAVERLMKGHLRRWAHLLRRARFFSLLSESSLAWTAAGPLDQRKHLLVLSCGNITERATLQLNAELPLPPGFAKTQRERQSGMDATTYDRLRVLTTELRRVLAQDRKVEMRLGPKPCLSHLSLRRLMQWL